MKGQKKRPANEHAKPAAAPVVAGPRFPSWVMAVLLVVMTVLAYQRVWRAGFIWDDDHHVTAPELQSLHGLGRIWTDFGATQQYYPLVHSVFWVEHRIWGDATAPYHWVNILLHACSALLVAKILRRLEIPGAWLAAAFFALHPVEVESVAWVSELKNTLSGVFYLSAALAYLGFDRNRSGGNYVLALGLFLLGLMSKTVIATLPAALLVVFWWQRGKPAWRRDALPLIPFFMAGIGAGLLTAWVERKFIIGTEGAAYHFSIMERCLIGGRGIWFYLGKLGWPVDLIFIYPRWNVSQTAWWQYLFPAAALVLLGVLVWRGWRGPLAALLFFAGTLFPALGFFDVYPFRYSFVADHFQYLASLGPLVLAAAGLSAAAGFIRTRKRMVARILCAGLLSALGTMTWKQCRMYADSETLWQTTIRSNPNSWMIHDHLGNILVQKGQEDEAIAQFQKALEINPDDEIGHNSLANSLAHQGRLEEAIQQYEEALKRRPDYMEAHNNLGNTFSRMGRIGEAISQFQEAVRLRPDFAVARYNLGVALDTKGQSDEAISQYRETIRLNPDFAAVHNDLGILLGKKGQADEAISQFQQAIVLNPDFAEAHNNLGIAFATKGQMEEAARQFQKATLLKPDFAEARKNLDRALRSR